MALDLSEDLVPTQKHIFYYCAVQYKINQPLELNFIDIPMGKKEKYLQPFTLHLFKIENQEKPKERKRL